MPITIPSIGEKFPEMEVMTQKGRLRLPDYFIQQGKWFVLFSHPADFTPVCTTEFVAFARRYGDFKRINTELIGLSVDSGYSHMKWIEWIRDKLGVEIPFPIIADPMGEVAKRLGLVHPTHNPMVTVRAVFIVDVKGIIRAILYYPTEAGRNIDEILRLVFILQLSDKYGRAVPANWPNNEVISDSLIVPPPHTEDEARERLAKFKCLDWWFCHEDGASEDEKKFALDILRRVAKCG